MLEDEVIILKKLKYNEADLIFHAIGKNSGHQSFIAKAVLSGKSKRLSALQPFCIVKVEFAKRKNDQGEGLAVVTGAQMKRPFLKLLDDTKRYEQAVEILKIVQKLDSGSYENLYNDLIIALSLSEVFSVNNLDLVNLWFRFKVAEGEGVLPNLDFDSKGEKIELTSKYSFDMGAGSLVQGDTGSISGSDFKLIKLIKSNDFSNLSKLSNYQASLKKVRLLVDEVLLSGSLI